MLLCSQCYNISDCDIYLSLQKLINKNKDINLRLIVKECNNYESGIRKLIEDMENENITIEEAKDITKKGFINFNRMDDEIQTAMYNYCNSFFFKPE